MTDRPSPSPFWRTVTVLASILLIGACQRVGSGETAGPPAPVPERAAPGLAVAGEDGRLVLVPARIGPVAAPDLGDLDPILHTPAALDPWLQERTAFWIGFWTSRESDYFSRYLERMGRYHLVVDRELEARGLPGSLRYLPIVESGYHPAAVSRVGATGLWQIMAPTGRALGLTVTSIVDDRRDPVASTVAALDYLEELHDRFDSWFLALAAYNAGRGRVGALLQRYAPDAEVPADQRFFEILPYLPAETRDFVPRFFAAASLARDPEPFGFHGGAPVPLVFDEVRVPDATSLDVIARAAEVDEDDVFTLNPQYLRGFTPSGEARMVRVPVGTGDRFERNYALIPPRERLSFLEHQVASGETFTHIARRYGVPVSDLTAANARIDPRRLQIGMRIIVPVAGSAPEGAAQVASLGAGSTAHVVAPGDSLWAIARRYGVTVNGLAGANGRTPDGILHPGEELLIP